MGSGSSKGKKKEKEQQTPEKQEQPQNNNAIKQESQTDSTPPQQEQNAMDPAQFDKLCESVFRNADADQNGTLDVTELLTVLQSPTLGLNLSEAETSEMIRMADIDGDSTVSYTEFVPMLRDVMAKVYAQKEDQHNDWAVVKEPDTNLPVYYNKRTGTFTKTKPMTFNEDRVELLEFETVEASDGTNYTVRYNEQTKSREYLNFDTGEWIPYDDNTTAAGDEDDDGTIIFKGKETFFYSAEINNVFYLNDDGEYAFVPSSFLATCKHIKAKIVEIQEYLPKWTNEIEIVMCLQICGYHVPSVMRYAEHNGLGEGAEKAYKAVADDRVVALEAQVASLQAQLTEQNDKVKEVEQNAGKSITRTNNLHTQQIEELQRKNKNVADEAHQQEEMRKAEHEKVVALKIEAEEAKVLAAKREKMVTDLLSVDSAANVFESAQNWKRRRSTMRSIKPVKSTASLAPADEAITEASEPTSPTVMTEKEEQTEEMLSEADATITDLEGQLNKKAAELKVAIEKAEQSAKEAAAAQAMVRQLKEAQEDDASKKEVAAKIKKLSGLVSEFRKFKSTMEAEAKSNFTSILPIIEKGATQAKGLKAAFAEEQKDIIKKYNKEVALRKQYYNTIQELKGNIRVFIRVRKDNRGTYTGGGVFKFPSKSELVVQDVDPSRPPKAMDFAAVFGPDSTQEAVFVDTKSTIMSVVDGYNVCIMAYGQTGSGKTFTMMGPEDNPGVNRRAIKELLESLQASEGTLKYELTAAQIEVYNEGVYDLLSEKARDQTKIKPRQMPNGVDLPGLTRRPVRNQEDVMKVLADGDKNRTVMATAMNSASSRSHLIFMIQLATENLVSGAKTKATLTLVDLAGSERIAKSGVTGEGLKEAAAINKSLSALGMVFTALAKKDPHIPYKNSALTHVLSDSLGGQAKCAMFVNASPLESNLPETISSLRFAQNIKNVEMGKAKKNKAR